MNVFFLVLKILAIVLGAGLVFSAGFTFYVAVLVFKGTMVRSPKAPRERVCSCPEDAEQVLMFERGLEFAARYKDRIVPLEIENEGLRLFGEFFDFGSKKAVIIIPGRTESLAYSYYFAEPYRKASFNVLVIDMRATGLSDGKYYSLGYKEYRDVIEWGKLIHDRFGNESIVLHGICIGAQSAVFTLTSDDCPEYFTGVCVDGMFKNFYETFKNHMKEIKKPIFPVCHEVMLIHLLVTGAKGISYGPFKAIRKLRKPILFIYTTKDIYSLPALGQKLYDDAASPVKEIVWFEKGGHSHIRINDEEGYDKAVCDFLERHKDVI